MVDNPRSAQVLKVKVKVKVMRQNSHYYFGPIKTLSDFSHSFQSLLDDVGYSEMNRNVTAAYNRVEAEGWDWNSPHVKQAAEDGNLIQILVNTKVLVLVFSFKPLDVRV